MTNPRILVSYARRDGADFSRTLSERLAKEHGFTVWRDLSQLEGGTDWWQQITDAIRRVEYVILVITPAALESRIVRDEWRFARTQGVCVIPVIGAPGLDFGNLSGWMQRRHFVDVQDPEQWRRLVRTLEGPCRTPRVPMMAEPPPDDFIDRSVEFEALKALLVHEAPKNTIAITAALKGAGGYGKTTLARALCHDDAVLETYYDGVLWVTLGEKPGDTATTLEDLIVILSGEPSGLTSAEARRSRLADLLHDRHMLFVLDDVWNAAHIQPLLLGGEHCARLITTRDSQTLPQGTREVRVDAMHAQEATSLLGSGLPGADPWALADLAARLGEWPLLLKLVNGMLRDRVLRAHDTLPSAVGHVSRLLDKRGLKAFDARDPVQRHDAVSATIESSVVRLSADERARFDELVVFREDADIPLDVVKLLWRRTGNLDDFESELLLQNLVSLSLLLDFDIRQRRVRVHDVIRAYVIGGLRPTHVETFHRELVEAYRTQCPAAWSYATNDGYLHRHLLFHMAAAGNARELRSLLLDPEWIEAKLRHTGIAAVLADYRTWANDAVTHLLESAVTLSAEVVAHDPDALLPQLLGRIDPGDQRELVELTGQWCRRPRPRPWLCPLTVSLPKAGGALVQTLRIGPSYGSSLGLSLADDGRHLAVTHRDHAEVFDLVHQQRLLNIPAAASSLTADGRLLAIGIGYYIVLYDVATQKDIWWSSQSQIAPICRVVVTRDGKWVAGCSIRNSVHVWNVDSGHEVFSVQPSEDIELFALAPDGDRIVLVLPGGILETWSVERGQALARWECSETVVRAVTFGSQGEVVVGSAWGTVQVWRADRDGGSTTIHGREVPGRSIAVTPSGRLVVVGFDDGSLECWRLEEDDRQRLDALASAWREWHWGVGEASIRAVAITPDGRWLASAEGNGALRIWDLFNAPRVRLEAQSQGRILNITPDGQRLITQSEHGSVTVCDVATGTVEAFLEERTEDYFNPSACTAELISHDGSWVASTRPNGRTSVWNVHTGKPVATLNSSSRTCALIPQRSRAVYLDRERQALVCVDGIGVDNDTTEWTVSNDADGIIALTVVPNTERVVAIEWDTGIVIWDLADLASSRMGVALAWGRAQYGGLDRVTTDGRLLVSFNARRVELFELLTGTQVLVVEAENYGIVSACLSPDGFRLVCADERRVRVWNLESRAEEAVFYSDTEITAVACASEELFIVGTVGGHVHRLQLRDGTSPSP